jgi:hypothetical protein
VSSAFSGEELGSVAVAPNRFDRGMGNLEPLVLLCEYRVAVPETCHLAFDFAQMRHLLLFVPLHELAGRSFNQLF